MCFLESEMFLEVCFLGPDRQLTNIGLSDGLGPTLKT